MNRFCSMFSQILQLFPRSDFQLLVKETKAERHARGFSCWDQFVSMMFCQLGRAHSLREICHGLSSCEGKLSHLGIDEAPHRSSLAYANGNCTRNSSFDCWSAATKTHPSKRSSDLRTSCSAWTPP
jgi:hypothetical protein